MPSEKPVEATATAAATPTGPIERSPPAGNINLEGHAPTVDVPLRHHNQEIAPGESFTVLTDNKDVTITAARSRRKKRGSLITDKSHTILQVRALITALEDAVSYNPRPGQNETTPNLFDALDLKDTVNLQIVKELLAELKRLNDYLERRGSVGRTQRPVVQVRQHLNKFLSRFAATAGTGAGILAIGVAATILRDTGYFDPTVIPMPKIGK